MSAPVPADPPEDAVARIMAETPIGMTAAAKLFGTFKDGKPVHPSTVARWHIDGVQSPTGGRLHLEAIHINRRLVTSHAAVMRFIRAQQGEPATPAPAATPRSPSARKKASKAADAELKKKLKA